MYKLTIVSSFRLSTDLTDRVIDAHIGTHRSNLCQRFADSMTDIRQSLAVFKGSSPVSAPPLNDHSSSLYSSIKTGLDSSITNLQVQVLLYFALFCSILLLFVLIKFSALYSYNT